VRHFCLERTAFFKNFGLHLHLDFTLEKSFGLDLDLVLKNQDWKKSTLCSSLSCNLQAAAVHCDRPIKYSGGSRGNLGQLSPQTVMAPS